MELYDLGEDLRERNNLAAEREEVVAELLALHSAFDDSLPEARWGAEPTAESGD